MPGSSEALDSEQRFRMLVDSVKDYAIFMLSPEGYIESWNSGAERIKGYRADEVVGKHFSLFYTPPDIEVDFPGHELRVAATEGRFETEGWRIRKDGTRFWASVVVTALYDQSRQLQGFAKVTRDLTERKRTEDLLRQSEERFRMLVEGVKDYAIFMLSPEGYIESWNAGAERIKGYQAEEVVGKHFSLFYTPEDLETGKPPMELRVATATGKYEEEGWRVRKDGSRFWANVLITALRDASGQLRGFAKVTRDITDRRQVAEELQASQERLRTLNEQLEQRVKDRTRQLAEVNAELEAFCYSVSHDLRAPLRGMLGFAEALREDYSDQLDETATDYLKRIVRASKRMESLIEDLLEYSRLSRDDIRVHPVNLNEVVKDALSHLASQVQERSASVNVNGPLPPVLAHRTTLVQVVTNLISNSLKFTEPGITPVVAVRGQATDQKVRLWIEDNGIGLKPEHHERIFRVFERLHGMETYPGTGVGLAIVQKGMERMRGTVGVESQLGAGSRFWIELPRAGDTQ